MSSEAHENDGANEPCSLRRSRVEGRYTSSRAFRSIIGAPMLTVSRKPRVLFVTVQINACPTLGEARQQKDTELGTDTSDQGVSLVYTSMHTSPSGTNETPISSTAGVHAVFGSIFRPALERRSSLRCNPGDKMNDTCQPTLKYRPTRCYVQRDARHKGHQTPPRIPKPTDVHRPSDKLAP